jgi:hypothetical protein
MRNLKKILTDIDIKKPSQKNYEVVIGAGKKLIQYFEILPDGTKKEINKPLDLKATGREQIIIN